MIARFIDRITEYVQIKGEGVRIRLINLTARTLSSVIAFTLLVGISVFLLLFVFLGLSFYLNVLLESQYLGFFLVAAFYLLLFIIILILFRSRRIQAWIENALFDATENQGEE